MSLLSKNILRQILNNKILVVDDDIDILFIVDFILKRNGFDVMAFNDPTNCFVEIVNQVKPAVILLDIQLGAYDGRILCKQVKEIEKHALIPVILFSANHHSRRMVQESLCNEFIEKPFDIDFLVKKISFYAQK